MQPVKLSEAQARLIWEVLVSDLGADPAEGEAFVATCVAGTSDQIRFHAAWPEVVPDDHRSMRVTYERSEFSLVEAPLRVLCSEQWVSTNQIWAAESVSYVFAEALERQVEESRLPRAFRSLRPSALAQGAERPQSRKIGKVSRRSQALAPAVSGATHLWRNEQAFYDANPKRLKGGPHFLSHSFAEDGETYAVFVVETLGELVAVREHGRDGEELAWNEKQHELLGIVDAPAGREEWILRFRRHVNALVRDADGDLAALRAKLCDRQALQRTYKSERAFVEGGPNRCYPQMDFGFSWREGGAYFRVSLVPESGEVIAVQREPKGEGRVELLGRVASPEELEKALKPLWRLVNTRDSLARVRGALKDTLAAPRAPRGRPSALAVA